MASSTSQSVSGDLVIKDFRAGIGPSPHVGFGDMRNMDISSIPGIARLNYAAIKKSGTAVADLPIQLVRNWRDTTEFFALDATGVVYQSNDNGETWSVQSSSGAPTGGVLSMCIWEDFLMVARQNSLGYFGPLTSAPTAGWNLSWNSIDTATDYHPMIRSLNDGKLYGGAAGYIFSLDKGHATGSFSPTGGSTGYLFTQQALDLLGNTTGEYRVKCLEELGSNLMIGTDHNANILDTEIDQDGVIFPWDRTSESFTKPIVFKKNGINQMFNINEFLYVQAGLEGRYYKSNGVQYTPLTGIPDGITNIDGGRFMRNSPGAIGYFDDKFFFGQNPGATASDMGGIGVWSVDLTTGVLAFEHAISTGNMGDASNVRIGSILPVTHDRLMIGWKDGATSGIDITGTGRSQNYSGYFESPLYQVGTILNPRTFTEIEFQLVQPLATGQGVKLKYRTNLSDSFATIDTYDFATLGAVISNNAKADIPSCEFIQIRGELTCAGTNATPQLRTVTLR